MASSLVVKRQGKSKSEKNRLANSVCERGVVDYKPPPPFLVRIICFDYKNRVSYYTLTGISAVAQLRI